MDFDKKTKELYSRLINAEYEYMSHVQSELTRKFLKETANFVWDDTHEFYETVIFPNKSEDKESRSPKQKQLYTKLVLVCHPDKCGSPWAHEAFTLLNRANEQNDIGLMEELYNHYECNRSFDDFIINYLENIKKQEEQRIANNASKNHVNPTPAPPTPPTPPTPAHSQGEQIPEQVHVDDNINIEINLENRALIDQETIRNLTDVEKELKVTAWKTQVWYIWYNKTSQTELLKDMFVHRNIYNQRVQHKLEQLKKWNETITQFPELVSKIPKPIVWKSNSTKSHN